MKLGHDKLLLFPSLLGVVVLLGSTAAGVGQIGPGGGGGVGASTWTIWDLDTDAKATVSRAANAPILYQQVVH